MIESKLSRSFDHEKLENPSYDDLVDVFEDLWVGHIVEPARILLENNSCEIAATTLLSSYFESIEMYMSGTSSDGKSKEYFIKGFCRVFNSNENGVEILARHFYKHVRCSLAHGGLLGFKVCYSLEVVRPVIGTYPKDKNGNLITSGEVSSIIINPKLILSAIEAHIGKYIKELRTNTSTQQASNFKTMFSNQIGRMEGDLVVAATEEELFGSA